MTKKLISSFVAVFAVFCLFAAAAFANDGTMIRYSTVNGLNVRTGPGTNYPVIAQLNNGDRITVYSIENDWAKIWCDSKSCEAYVFADYLSTVANGNYGGGQNNRLNGSYNVTTTTTAGVNFRSGPGTQYSIYCVIPSGSSIYMQTVTDGWAYITYNGTNGYISTDYIAYFNGGSSGGGSSSGVITIGKAMTTNGYANVRTGEGTQYDVMTVKSPGESLYVYSVNTATGWAKVSADSQRDGYMSCKMISGLEQYANGSSSSSSSSSSYSGNPNYYNGYDWSNVYDYNYYRATNPDLYAQFGTNTQKYIQHFIQYGVYEGRQGRSSFNVETYKSEHPELREKLGDDNLAWCKWACGIPQ